jgi:hypothetical protein
MCSEHSVKAMHPLPPEDRSLQRTGAQGQEVVWLRAPVLPLCQK